MTNQPSDFGGLFSVRRIIIVGANGAGKTWLAVRLSEMLSLPAFHNDALALDRNWTYRPSADVSSAREAVMQRNSWIIEGGPSVLTSNAVTRAEVIIWLDPSRRLRLWRVFYRTVRFFARERPEHPPGNREWPGPRQVRFLAKTWTRDAEVRACISESVAKLVVPVIRLRSGDPLTELFGSSGNTPRQGAKRFE